jgi:hypothetical protein
MQWDTGAGGALGRWSRRSARAVGRWALGVYASDAAYEAGLMLAAVLITLTVLVSLAPRQALSQPLAVPELPDTCWQVDYAC